MNLFILDSDPTKAAQWSVDKHTIKILLEAAELLCNTFHLQGFSAPYKLAFPYHPLTKWVGESKANFQWTLDYGRALCDEYTARYHKIHKTTQVFDWIEENKGQLKFFIDNLTPFVQCMPIEFQNECAVTAYRNYYKVGKKHLHSWKRNKPSWM